MRDPDTPDLSAMTPAQIAQQLRGQFDPETDDKPDVDPDNPPEVTR